MLFTVGCSSVDMGNTGTDSETKTESPADDKKYYDKDGKIILLPPENEDEKKDEEEAPATEKADFSTTGTKAAYESANARGILGSAFSFEQVFTPNRQAEGYENSRPETIAGVITAAQIHYQLFKDNPAYGNPGDSSGWLRVDYAANGGHAGAGHHKGYAADVWSNQIIHPAAQNINDPQTRETPENMANPDVAKYIKNKHLFMNELKKVGIEPLDETFKPGSSASYGVHIHLEFGDFKGGGILFDIFDGLKNIGNVLSAIINRFTDLGAKAYGKLMPYVVPLLWLLALLDISVTCLFGMFDSQSGTQNLFEVFIPKIMKYTGIYAVMVFWPSFINSALQTVNYINETIAPDQLEAINQNVSQPQLLMQKGFDLIRPGIDFIANVTFDQFIASLFPCLLIMVSAIIAMGALMAVAIYITIVYIEFFVGAGLSIFMAPFSALRHTKFLAEGASSWLINNGIRLVTLSLMTGMVVEVAFKSTSNTAMVQGFQNLGNHFGNQSFFDRVSNLIPFTRMAENVAAIAKRIFTSSNAMSIDEQLMATVAAYMSVCAVLVVMCYLVYRCTESLSGALRGSLSIPD